VAAAVKKTVVALAAVLLLSACGTAREPGTAAATTVAEGKAVVRAEGEHNAFDVMYLQMMVTHHEQALDLVKLAESKATKGDIKTLAKAVDVTQSDELTMMKTWLTDWKEPTSVDDMADMHASHGGTPMTTDKTIATLGKEKGKTFDSDFLNLFIGHQHNAVEMAQLENTKGKNAEAKAFAVRVRESRTGQIQQMLKLLNS
jgi:uncharacterized protein (DUF305 family)